MGVNNPRGRKISRGNVPGTEEAKWKTTLKGIDRRMTPTKKKKMTAKTKNSPVAMNVAVRLGLKALPNVKMMTARLERAHLQQASIEAKHNFKNYN